MTRLIARLDIKSDKLIKGINYEGLRIIGDPNEYALKFFNEEMKIFQINAINPIKISSTLKKIQIKIFLIIKNLRKFYGLDIQYQKRRTCQKTGY